MRCEGLVEVLRDYRPLKKERAIDLEQRHLSGGYYLWCLLPEGVDAAGLTREVLSDNIVLAPGNVFSVSQSMGSFMRFNVSQMQSPELYKALERELSDQ